MVSPRPDPAIAGSAVGSENVSVISPEIADDSEPGFALVEAYNVSLHFHGNRAFIFGLDGQVVVRETALA